MRQIFLDTETTGLSADDGDRIIEVGCVEMVNRRLTGNNLHFYVNPERASHEDAVRVHGLTDEFLSNKPLFAAIADELFNYLAGAEIIIHNAAFDVGFLNAELKRLKRPLLAAQVHGVVDSLLMAREMFPGKANSLDALCRRLEVDNSGRTLHGALLDAELLAEVYIRMTRGQDALIGDDVDDEQVIPGDGGVRVPVVDFSSLMLKVEAASEDELALHEAVLTDLDAASKSGAAVWRRLVA